MKSCPNFYCLRYAADNCDQYPACDGCPTQFDCSQCSNQTEIVEGGVLPCDLRNLPEACRSCQERAKDTFSESFCTSCPSSTMKGVIHAQNRRQGRF